MLALLLFLSHFKLSVSSRVGALPIPPSWTPFPQTVPKLITHFIQVSAQGHAASETSSLNTLFQTAPCLLLSPPMLCFSLQHYHYLFYFYPFINELIAFLCTKVYALEDNNFFLFIVYAYHLEQCLVLHWQ